jgi:hypothetical protein
MSTPIMNIGEHLTLHGSPSRWLLQRMVSDRTVIQRLTVRRAGRASGVRHYCPPNTRDKLRSSNTLGFVSFIPLLGGLALKGHAPD